MYDAKALGGKEKKRDKNSHFGDANSCHGNFDIISHNNNRNRKLDWNLQGQLTSENSIMNQ